MNDMAALPRPVEAHVAVAPRGVLGPVADDWAAANVWLRAIASRGRRNSPKTVATYRYHMAKLRWFCEQMHGVSPSRWSVQDVETFSSFLAALPETALCAQHLSGAYVTEGEPGHTPFRKQPSLSSRMDILRCVHAMFRAWRDVGYITHNPMGLHGAGSVRKLNVQRALTPDLYVIVLEAMEALEKTTFEMRQAYARDRFIFIALRELGLRSSELIKASMSAFTRLSDPKDSATYWVMEVRAETAKGQKARKIPVTRNVMDALGAYREVFGLPPLPTGTDTQSLILSLRTRATATTRHGNSLKTASLRRFYGAWRPITTRQGLYQIVKGRLASAAVFLDSVGDFERASVLREASTHWLRHTFAKATLLTGQDIRHVAAWLGHADLGTTMVYTDQDALDLIRATNAVSPGLLAPARTAAV